MTAHFITVPYSTYRWRNDFVHSKYSLIHVSANFLHVNFLPLLFKMLSFKTGIFNVKAQKSASYVKIWQLHIVSEIDKTF